MKTPKEYKDNLEKGIVTAVMLENVLYSYNKRAKNYRDRARNYRERRRYNWYYFDKYDNEGQCEEKKEMLYGKKSDILRHCPEFLTAIHKVSRIVILRIKDTEDEYEDYIDEHSASHLRKNTEVIREGGYYDRDTGEYISFIDVRKTVYDYYLFYEFPTRSFHSPIESDEEGEVELTMYKDLNIIEIDSLNTYGKDVNDLLSLPFCDKVWQYVTTR